MHGNNSMKWLTKFYLAAGWLVLTSGIVQGQDTLKPASPAPVPDTSEADRRALDETIRSLQVQLQNLSGQLNELREGQERARAETRKLRNELEQTKMQLAAKADGQNSAEPAPSSPTSAYLPTAVAASEGSAQEPGTAAERIAKMQEDQELAAAKIDEQSQTKVESGSKYRLRLSGIVLLNLFDNHGTVDNLDFPQIATEQGPLDSSHTFGGSLRQSQIGLEMFGPDVAGARTSANVRFDFAGGSPNIPYGNSTGFMRFRTGVIRLDWAKTSLIAGQDSLFFAPLAPTSLASLAVPSLSYSGNLWAWTPQVRIEHRVTLSEASSLLFQGGILDAAFGGVLPTDFSNRRSPTQGEQSGQPAYATRISLRQHAFNQEFTIGVGGYYGRQFWGPGRNIDSWTATTDLTLPLGRFFELSGEFYRGRAVGGFGGGIGQILVSGNLSAPGTFIIRGLDSMGGWAQLKFKPKSNFEVNGALGEDSPFSSELRRFPSGQYTYGSLLSKNLSPFVNFIYQVRSDVAFSVEYRRLRTTVLDYESHAANLVNLSLGYIF
jgi:hypothetical protein